MNCRQARYRERKRIKHEESEKRKFRRWKLKSNSVSSISEMSIASNSSLSRIECSPSDSYQTPDKFKKQIRQRSSEYNRQLPESRELKCAIVNRVVGKMLKSPSTAKTMTSIMSRYMKVTPKRDGNDSSLVHTLMKIQKYKTSRNNTKLAESVNQLKETYSIRAAAKKLNMHYSELYRLLKCRKEHGRSLSTAAKQNVINAYSGSNISLQLPFKKYAKFYYLRTSLAVAYDTYVREQLKLGYAVLSQSSVYRCLQGKFRIRKKIPFKDTQCADCVNNSLLVDALIVGKVKGVKRRITHNVLNSYCKIESTVTNLESCNNTKVTSRKLDFVTDEEVITDHNRDCIFRVCKKCSAMTLQESIIKQNPGISWNEEVTWHQWKNVIVNENNANQNEGQGKLKASAEANRDVENVDVDLSSKKQEQKKRVLDKVRYRGSRAQLLTIFIQSLSQMSIHLFHFRWQAMQFEECKKQLQVGDVLFIMDFATNYSHHRQDEIHGAFWCRNQTTLHPIIIYFPCQEKCGHLVRDEVMILSSDLKHDSFAVNSFIDKALAHLKAKNVPVKRIVMWSDNCGPQYKSCKVFDSVSKQEIPVQRNYFCARHGKAEADGAIGRLSMHIDAVVRSGSHEFSDAGELVRYCKLKLTVDKDKEGMCCHWQRHYFQVSDIDRDDDTVCQTVKGTLSLHSVRNVGVPGIIEVRESSCFCEVCFHNEPGECKNASLVEPFAWASVYKNLDIEPSLENKLWEGHSVQFRYARKHMFRPKSRKRDSKIATNVLPKKRKTEQQTLSDVEFSSDSCDESEYEDNIPLIDIKEGLRRWFDTTPISHRTRSRLSQNKLLRCNNIRDEWNLDDYERLKEEKCDRDKIAPTKLGVTPLSMDVTLKEESQNVTVTKVGISNLPKNKNRSLESAGIADVSKLHKTIVELPTSTPIRQGIAERNIMALSPIPGHSKGSDLSEIQVCDEYVVHSHDFHAAYNWNMLHRKMLTCQNFKALKNLVKREFSEMPSLPLKCKGDMSQIGDVVDLVALKLIPNDIPQRFRCHHPTTITADGNCFCRSISRLVFGSQNEHLQIRCRIVADLALNVDRYTDHEYLMRKALHVHKRCPNIASFYCIYSGVNVGNRDESQEGIQSVFRDDVMRIRKLGEYCGPWQFHSIANVLNTKITMVFPAKDIRYNVRVDMNREFWPNNVSNMRYNEFGLLWTKTCQIEGKRAQYNHIVPLINRYIF